MGSYKLKTLLCILLMMSFLVSKTNGQTMPDVSGSNQAQAPARVCDNPEPCMCQYPTPSCSYPSAPLCGTYSGLTYLSMGLTIALIAGVAAIMLSQGEGVHSH